jgi:hypothetical protein
MSDPALQPKNDSLAAEGLEDLFVDDVTVTQPSRNPCVTLAQGGLTFKAACDYFGLKPTALRLRIKSGDIAADKISGANGPEWRIYPDKPAQPLRDPSVTVALPLHSPDSNKLLEVVQDLQNKLQAASFRNGYLESQLESHKEQIKLLTDSQHKQGWWPRLRNWFTSDR